MSLQLRIPTGSPNGKIWFVMSAPANRTEVSQSSVEKMSGSVPGFEIQQGKMGRGFEGSLPIEWVKV